MSPLPGHDNQADEMVQIRITVERGIGEGRKEKNVTATVQVSFD